MPYYIHKLIYHVRVYKKEIFIDPYCLALAILYSREHLLSIKYINYRKLIF